MNETDEIFPEEEPHYDTLVQLPDGQNEYYFESPLTYQYFE